MTVEIHEHPFDPWQAVSEYRSTRLALGKSGASAVFVGTMRDFNEGDEVQAMVLEHYPGMTEPVSYTHLTPVSYTHLTLPTSDLV